MAIFKPNSPRRREVRRTITRQQSQLFGWVTHREFAWAVLWVVITITISSLIALSGRHRDQHREGQVVHEAIVARVPFTAIDQRKTVTASSDARDREPPVYEPNRTYLQSIRGQLDALVQIAADESITSVEQIPLEQRKSLHLTPEAFIELRGFIHEGKVKDEWKQLADQFMEGFAGIVMLSPDRATLERDTRQNKAFFIAARHPVQGESLRAYNTLLSVDDDPATFRNRITTLANKFPRALRQTVLDMATQNRQPTYLLNEDETNRRKQAAYDNEPPVKSDYVTNAVIVPAGSKLRAEDRETLAEEQRAYLRKIGHLKTGVLRFGSIGLVAILAIGIWGYTAACNPRVLSNPMRGVALTSLLLLTQAGAVGLTHLWPQTIFAAAIFPTLAAAIILAIAYDQRFALALGAAHALLVTVSLDLSVGFALILFVGVAVAVSRLHEIRNRSKLLKVGFMTGLAMAVAVWCVGITERPLHVVDTWRVLSIDSIWLLATGLLTGLIVQGLLPAVERAFKVTTSMTLKELNDASHPLLRRLAELAPGTYQHSLRIADMSEAAADTIGANGLMCRVGAMYHDIGKINKPMYFVENQGGGPNRHNKLSPAMSLLIIVGHVKDGIEMAREYHLPPVIRHFIESHHGTTLVEYFYHAAKQRCEETNTTLPTEFEFRYPGPKPQTREAAILMLCDTLEGAARTLPEPTPVRIEQLVTAMARKRLNDGQFDECNLTLQELHKIEQSITKTLNAIYHGRIAYPDAGKPLQPAGRNDPNKQDDSSTSTKAAS